MTQPISSLMTRQVRSVSMDDTVASVEALFAREGLSWAPVLESALTIVGVISAADLLRFHSQGQDPTAVPAWQRCSYKPITVSPDTPVSEVARPMLESDIHHVVVTDSEGIAGVVSSLDFVRTFLRDRRHPGSRAVWIAQTGSPPAAPTWSRPAFFAAYRASAARSSTSCNASSESSKERTPVEEARLRRREAGKASVKLPQFHAINIVLGNLKTALCGTDHAFNFAKYAHRYRAETQYRFNRRFDLRSILQRRVQDAAATLPRPPAFVRGAEECQ